MKPLRILSGGAAEALVGRTAPAFTAQSGFDVTGTFGAVGDMAAKLRGGEAADIMILTRALIADLEADGLLVVGSAVDLGAVPTSVAVRADEAAPDVSSMEALRAALQAAPALFCPNIETSTAGRHVACVLDALGIRREMDARLRVYPNGATAMAALAASGIPGAIGTTQATEILNTPGIRLVAHLPPGADLRTVYTAAVTAGSPHPGEAGAFIAALGASPSRPDLGFEV
ncbi:substrate-binding domain-containing protein [Aquabacter spiritensis]|uniref:Molybdate transport system substrate-binding protein n=1 Tax=Aquabacter spiritensis TaxID=933073 RepID=A0A4R3LVX1_9HYPH|nr:substrate-binding domain-containing protein [Aquabacter spiritensis]TCT03849.1 molybdate transport system substrate-binding protein [Aquabacter spiritensis]